MPKAIDLTGQRFDRLTVVRSHPERTKHGSIRWVCDCGKEVIVPSGNLRGRPSASCGCKRRPHGGFGTRLYGVWSSMRRRCLNPNNPGYKDYGGRGIKICDEWSDFANFRDWAIKNDLDKGTQIDRIDNDGNYEPSNCRVATPAKNNQNRRDTKLSAKKVILIRYLLKNSNMLQKDIGKIFGVPQNTISQVRHGHLWGSITKDDWERALP